jgi:hypothetical protein
MLLEDPIDHLDRPLALSLPGAALSGLRGFRALALGLKERPLVAAGALGAPHDQAARRPACRSRLARELASEIRVRTSARTLRGSKPVWPSRQP